MSFGFEGADALKFKLKFGAEDADAILLRWSSAPTMPTRLQFVQKIGADCADTIEFSRSLVPKAPKLSDLHDSHKKLAPRAPTPSSLDKA